ncbi:MAG: F0F1 ATP synthase subunit delta [Rhodospirillaceae bacterium]|nr:F0F1 ATP synthase subunit delta [Rhodospirillaceae bacterium]MDP6621685.1 F0F1 ATP synthase subunit delta [Alphaproteobacteria bacterium]
MVAETAIISGLAGRYAAALFELAAAEGTLDEVAADLDGIAALVAESADLERLVRSPVLSREDQGRALAAVLEQAGACELCKRFVGLVARNRRLFALVDMVRAFRVLLAEHRGEVTAQVVSARPLGDGQMAAVKAQLAGLVGQDVSVETSVDEDLIAGLVVKVGSRMIDSSLRTKLRNLEFAMKGVG